jgi:hypothetical protein
MIQISIGTILIILGSLCSWLSLRGLLKNRTKPHQRLDASVFAVMELRAQEYRARITPQSVIPRARRESLNLEQPSKEEGRTPEPGLFGTVHKSASPADDSLPPNLRIRSLDREKDGETKTLGL